MAFNSTNYLTIYYTLELMIHTISLKTKSIYCSVYTYFIVQLMTTFLTTFHRLH